MTSERTITFAGEQMILNSHRTIYWPDQKMLILADMHVGKPAHFRNHGMAIPQQVANHDLDLLKQLIAHYRAQTIMMVGDLFHAGNNPETKIFLQWLENLNTLSWITVMGNHDKTIFNARPILALDEIHEQYAIGNINFVHKPDNAKTPSISGHIHPGVVVKGNHHQKIKLPCFLVSEHKIILPAFSHFTGLDTRFYRENKDNFRPFAIAGNEIVQV